MKKKVIAFLTMAAMYLAMNAHVLADTARWRG